MEKSRTEVKRRILVVEDDADIADILQLNLADEGYAVDRAEDGEKGLAFLRQTAYDALILDIMLPGIDGLEVCRQVRAMPRYTPIIIISARTGESQRVLGLELGADDYVTKPFSLQELLARVRALFRRVDALDRGARQQAGLLESGDLAIDPLARQVRCRGEAVELTAREFDLLFYFARHPGQVFSRMDLLTQVWGYGHEGYEHTVNTHINRLRGKIEADPARPEMIRTVWGVGYKFTPEAGQGETP
ncbi:MAG: two component transcriptional regulator [bacterium]|nr:MAG: two component transcriptional regulator [bacterium]KAF0150038.1 MAG: two component transcriptional regulator [bacterium]KAF0169146.1 MAG: two component transcriptional regulator [bacterium]TXT16877.1 MAG: two component transcriptional regulator [bacterium]